MRPKTQCQYCRQPNYIDELACRFCGAPLPMAAIPSIQEGEVEKVYYGGIASTVAKMCGVVASTSVPPAYFEVVQAIRDA